jgi:peroxiredoxin
MNSNKTFFQAVIFFLALVIQSCSGPDKKEPNTVSVQNDLPKMVVTKSDGSLVNMKDQTGKIVLILFQTDCDHCQREAAAIEENILAFNQYTLYFVTTSSIKEIETFANDYKLTGHPNVHFGQTTNQSVLDNFGPIEAPSVYIFSSEKKLVKSFNGETEIGQILKYI